jgi:hypothetical protein
VSFYVSLVCEATDQRDNRCWTEDSYGDPQSATEARRRLAKQGWHRTRDGRDICPDCWEAGRR